MVTLGIRRVGSGVLDKNLRGGGGDPLPLCNLNADDFIVNYRGGSR